jgi:hypothetical protein
MMVRCSSRGPLNSKAPTANPAMLRDNGFTKLALFATILAKMVPA